jgi:hypothetical protein
MDHLVIMKKSWGLSDKILSGEKTIESRWYKQRRAPWDKISEGDNLYIKNSGEPVTIQAKVSEVLQFHNLTWVKVKEILAKYGKEIGIEDLGIYFEMFQDKKYCILVFLSQVMKVEPFDIDKAGFGNMSAWICVENIKQIERSEIDVVKLSKRALTNSPGHLNPLRFPLIKGKEIGSFQSFFREIEKLKLSPKRKHYWVAISGSWRLTSAKIKKDVRSVVGQIMRRGGGIVSGGALGVDYFATDEAMKIDSSRIRIFLPVLLDLYAKHYRQRAREKVITSTQAEELIAQLSMLKKIDSSLVVENGKNFEVNRQTYFERNTAVVDFCDGLVAFHVNESEGVADTIKKAQMQGKPVVCKKYRIQTGLRR